MSSGKVLLVEDNPDEEELARIAFKRCGLSAEQIIVARDGREAVDYLFGEGAYADREPQEAPSVIFLDLKMPVMDGIEVLKRIRGNDETAMIPTVILTSSDEPSDIREGYRHGANSYVRKAEDFEEFIADIAALRAYWLELNVPPYD